MKKKKVSEMTSEEALEELEKVTKKLESLAPKVLGGVIKVSKSFYALTKYDKKREALLELLRTDEDLRRDFRKNVLEYASAIDDLLKNLSQVEDVARLKIEELEKKREEKRKKKNFDIT